MHMAEKKGFTERSGLGAGCVQMLCQCC
ncbi:MAG: hypothetical protein ACJAYX_000555, partial [Planctomycetota bacterium]